MAALAKKDYVVNVMYVVGFLDLFAVSMTVPLISKHAREIGASPTTVGLIGSVYGGMQLFASPLIGKWSDRSGRRFVLLWCLMMSSIGYGLLGISTTILLLLISRIPPGIFKHTQELARGVITAALPKSEHAQAYGRFNSISQMGFIFGPIIGGHIAEMTDGFLKCALVTASIFLFVYGHLNGVSNLGFVLGPSVGGHIADMPGGFMFVSMCTTTIFIINAVTVWWMVPSDQIKIASSKPEDKQVQSEESSSPLAFLKSFKDISWTNLWDVFLVRFLCGFAVIVYRSNFSMMLSYKYEATAKTTGYIISYTAAVGTVSGFFVGKITRLYGNDTRLLYHMAMLQFVTLLGLTFSPSLEMLVLSLTPLSLANAVARVASTNLTIDRGHGHDIGTLLGLGASTLSVARMLAPTLGGVAQELYVSGPGLVGAISAGLGVIVLGCVSMKYEAKQKSD